MRRAKPLPVDSFYVRVGERLWADRRNSIVFGLGAAAYALAQGVIAGCAGLLAKALLTYDDAHQLAAVDPPWIWGTDPTAISALREPMWVCLLGFAAACVKAAAAAAVSYAQKSAAFRIGDAERQKAIVALLFHGRGPSTSAFAHAAIALRIRDVEAGVSEGVMAVLKAAAQIVPLAAALALVSTPLAGLAVLALVPFGVLMARTRSRLRSRHATSRRQAEELSASIDELVRHVDLWRTYGAGRRVREEIAELGERAGRSAASTEAARAAVSGANEALGALVLLGLVAMAGSVAIDPASIVAFCAAFFLLYRPLRELADGTIHAERGAEAAAELTRLFDAGDARELLSSPDGPAEARTRRTWPLSPLELANVRVRSGPTREQMPTTTLVVGPGEIVALVGPTGCGKTTLLRGLLGLAPIEGGVRYGGYDLRGAGVGPDDRPFAWVPQEPAIVAGTLEQNVALGSGGASERDARAALEAVGAGALAQARNGTAVRAGGEDLSGGERQWVALARALASGLPVLLLDEPTAGLDARSQRRVLDALAAIRGQRTILMVTHRPEPLALADRVVDLSGKADQNCASIRGSFSNSTRMLGMP